MTRSWKRAKPLWMVIGPGGLWEAYPDHPPSLAMIQHAHLRLLLGGGFSAALLRLGVRR